MELLLPTFAAVCLSAVITPLVRRLAVRRGFLDAPEPARKLHRLPVPRLGGVAVVTSASVVTGVSLHFAAPGLEGGGALLLAGGLVAALGLYDDLRWAGAPLKLTVQLAAAWLAVRGGWWCHAVELPLLGVIDLGPLGVPLSMLWLAGLSNAFNLVDGLDGLAAGLALVSATALAGVALLADHAGLALLLAVLAGSVAGFLPFNLHPARIFLGDCGSLFLGFMLGAVSLRALATGDGELQLLPALLALAVPLTDTAFAFVRRSVAGRNPFKGDLGHLHHRLLAAGLDQPRAVRVLTGVAALLAVAAVATARR